MTEYKLFRRAIFPICAAATVTVFAGCKNDPAKDVVPSSGGASSSTKVAALPPGSKSVSHTVPSTGSTVPPAKSSAASGTTAKSATTAGAPSAVGQPTSSLTQGTGAAMTTAPGAPGAPGVNPGGNAAPTQNPIDQLLQLTPQQQARNTAIIDDANHQMTNLRSQQTLSPQEKMKKAAAISESVHRQLMAILTPQQRSRLAAKQDEQMRLQSGRFVSDLDQGVHLSPVQKARMLALMGNAMRQERALEDNDTLNLSQKQATARTLHQSLTAQMQALLTPQQLKTVEALNAQAMAAARARSGQAQQPNGALPPNGAVPPPVPARPR